MNLLVSVRKYFWLLVALSLTLLIYRNTFDNQFLWDDGYFMGAKTSEETLVDIGHALSGEVPMSYKQVYRPVRGVIYALANYLYQGNAFYYHLQALLVYLAIVAVVWLIVRRLFPEQPNVAHMAAILFGVHPIHVEAVTFMTASFDTVGILFFFVAFLLYLHPKQGIHRRYHLWAILAFFTYEQTFVLLPLIICYEWLIKQKQLRQAISTPKYLWRGVVSYVFIRLILGLYGGSRAYVFGSFWHDALFIPVRLVRYWQLIAFPRNLSINHTIYPGLTNLWYEDSMTQLLSFDPSTRAYIVPLLLLLGIVIIIYRLQTRKPYVTFLLLWSLLSLVPVLGLLPLNSIFAERYAFIPSFGFILLAAWGLSALIQRSKITGLMLVIPIIVIFATWTWNRNDVWQDMFSLWGHPAHMASSSAYIYRQLAAGYFMEGDYEQSLRELERAARLKPSNDVFFKIGIVQSMLGRCDEAVESFNTTPELRPHNSDQYTYLADCFESLGQSEEAQRMHKKSLELSDIYTME